MYVDGIKRGAGLLLRRDYDVAFIGSKGIGKSTAICKVTGLEVPSPDNAPAMPVLEAGGGGVTICDVHLATGQGFGLLIEPSSEDEIRAHVIDFAEHVKSTGAADDDSEEAGQGIAQGSTHVPLRFTRPPYPAERIEVWDWTGVNIKQESQKLEKRPQSIQARVIQRLLQAGDYAIVFDDDASGEAADVVAIKLIGSIVERTAESPPRRASDRCFGAVRRDLTANQNRSPNFRRTPCETMSCEF